MVLMTTCSDPGRIVVRNVWADNLESEFTMIRNLLVKYPYITMDTEFPGVVYCLIDGVDRHNKRNSPATNYTLLKQNVDALKLIQLGITLTDSKGNLPQSGKERYIWQFNFKDFDVTSDPHAPHSVQLLKQHGMNFELIRKCGVDTVKFAELMMGSGLVCNGESVTWVTFHGAYDFGYLSKVLTQRPLPDELDEFLKLVKVLFGENVFDVKYMITFCNGLYGGLDKVGTALQLDREVGCSHQSGSDSLLTWRVFQNIRDDQFSKVEGGIHVCSRVLYGLETS